MIRKEGRQGVPRGGTAASVGSSQAVLTAAVHLLHALGQTFTVKSKSKAILVQPFTCHARNLSSLNRNRWRGAVSWRDWKNTTQGLRRAVAGVQGLGSGTAVVTRCVFSGASPVISISPAERGRWAED